jgi:hypothetical protein
MSQQTTLPNPIAAPANRPFKARKTMSRTYRRENPHPMAEASEPLKPIRYIGRRPKECDNGFQMKGATPMRTTYEPTTYPVSTRGTWRNLESGQTAGDYTC